MDTPDSTRIKSLAQPPKVLLHLNFDQSERAPACCSEVRHKFHIPPHDFMSAEWGFVRLRIYVFVIALCANCVANVVRVCTVTCSLHQCGNKDTAKAIGPAEHKKKI